MLLRGNWACLGLVLWATSASAQEPSTTPQVHGFVSQGYLKTTKNNYLAATARDQGSFDFTEVGLNVTQQVSRELRVGMQVFAHDLGPLGNYTPQLDWYYLDYRFFRWLGLRAGKTKLPWGLYNESNDVDAGRVPILLPQSLYPVSNRESLFAQTGGELYGDISLGSAGDLEYRAYGGTIFVNVADASAQLRGFDVPYDAGGRLMWLTPLDGLQLGGSLQVLRFDFQFTPTPEQTAQYEMAGQLPADFGGTIWAQIPAKLWVASAEYLHEGLWLAAEYGRSYLDYETNLVLPRNKVINQGGYLMASYQVTPWFTPGVYYSAAFKDITAKVPDGTDTRGTYQHDVAATLRYDVTPNWLVKLEGHYMHGTGGLTSQLNDNKPLSELSKDWGVFLAKTTAYF
jgi:hypothetical protein